MARRRFPAGQGDQPRLLLPIQHEAPRGADLLLAPEGRLAAAFHQPPADVDDRLGGDADGIRRAVVGPGRAQGAFVHLQEDLGMPPSLRRGLALAEDLLQLLAFLG